MKVAELIEKRQPLWQELERLCSQMTAGVGRRDPVAVARFSELYRAACADLALAEAYQLPPKTVDYLHQLVARAHNQMYRSQAFQWHKWYRQIFVLTPQVIFNDRCVHFAFIVFWGLFLISGYLSYEDVAWPNFAADVVGQKNLDQYETMYEDMGERSFGMNSSMMGFYVYNNAGIGLKCFVSMLFIPFGLVTLCYNAVALGAVFGYMFRPELGAASDHFKNFVTAHGPLELTAIVLSAGAGMKIGLSWIMTYGLRRGDSLVKTAREALPIALCAVVLFCMAAVIEGFISPMATLPWWFKGAVAVVSSLGLMIYFVCLGFPRRDLDEEQMF